MTRLRSIFHLSRGEKAYALAYAIVMSVSAGLTVFVLAGIEGVASLPADGSYYSVWTAIAGVIGGAFALYAARGWLGLPGAFGWVRALVGGTAAALIAAVIAGSLIMPIYGTFYAPVMLATEFVEFPLLALGWFGAIFVAHSLMTSLKQERTWGYNEADVNRELTAQLSPISRVNLYHQSE